MIFHSHVELPEGTFTNPCRFEKKHRYMGHLLLPSLDDRRMMWSLGSAAVGYKDVPKKTDFKIARPTSKHFQHFQILFFLDFSCILSLENSRPFYGFRSRCWRPPGRDWAVLLRPDVLVKSSESPASADGIGRCINDVKVDVKSWCNAGSTKFHQHYSYSVSTLLRFWCVFNFETNLKCHFS